MSRKNSIYLVLAILTVFIISGCETVPKKFKEEVSGIKSRVETLESKVETVEAKQADVERSASEQTQAIEELKESARAKIARTNISVKSRGKYSKEWVRDIQTCLKNAGFYNGKIDGVKGKKTRRAIREFQKANGLSPDGTVGKKTWELLSKYSSGGAAQSSGSTEEGPTK